ncbi:MAG: TetR/AcrR family transcriptional regulator [Deltaproteobacteria bacterium]|nr:TetR/AcrR family transcriptional regulator [Deltaproteobacteria bacterium]
MVTEARAGMRERIVSSALRLMKTAGVKKFAQPQVAKEAGIPQGHLTYYFPRKLDLVLAVAEQHLAAILRDDELMASIYENEDDGRMDGPTLDSALTLLSSIASDMPKTRVLLGLIAESDSDRDVAQELAPSLGRTVRQMRIMLARVLNRAPDDEDVWLVQAALVGLSVQAMIAGESDEPRVRRVLARLIEWVIRQPARSSSPPRRSVMVPK